MDEAENPLDDRKERILRQIVEGYVRSGEPVGSRSVADDRDLGVSAATVRNEMGILEREGYITHPHTSAGRIPTDKGYRYYVDQLSAVGPSEQLRGEIRSFLEGTLSALDDMLRRSSELLAELTEYASVTTAPPAAEARLSRVQLIPVGGPRLLLVLVGDVPWHEEHLVHLPSGGEPTEGVLGHATEVANRAVAGKPLAEAADALDDVPGDEEQRTILRATAEAIRVVALRARRVYTGGTSRVVVWEPGPEAQRVLELLEGSEVESLLLEPAPEEVAVRIGRELGISDLDDLSLIATGYRFGRRSGALGVLGPTRMDYPSVIATVGEVARSLSRALRRLSES